MPERYREDWAGQLARPAARPQRHTGSAIVFRVGTEWFGMATDLCSRVLPQRPIHSLPHRQEGVVLGVANVEGALVLCVSLAAILGLAAEGAPAASARNAGGSGRLLVVAAPEGRLGMPIQEAYGVCRFREEDLQAVPGTLAKGRASHTRAVLPLADRAVGLLDAESLLRSIGGQLA
jgi:chemotaxis-related protein WspD